MLTVNRAIYFSMSCLVVLMSTGCGESELCKTAKAREANAILDSQKATEEYESYKKNKESHIKSMRESIEKAGGLRGFDYESEYEAHLNKLLFKSVDANYEEGKEKSLRIQACK